jgi:hypothetical protein
MAPHRDSSSPAPTGLGTLSDALAYGPQRARASEAHQNVAEFRGGRTTGGFKALPSTEASSVDLDMASTPFATPCAFN